MTSFEVLSIASLALPTSFVDNICLSLCIFPSVSDLFVLDTRAGALVTTLETIKEYTIALESQAASKEVKTAAKVVHVDSLEVHVRITGEGKSQMLATIHEHVPQLHTAKAAHSRTEVALRSAESQLQVFFSS